MSKSSLSIGASMDRQCIKVILVMRHEKRCKSLSVVMYKIRDRSVDAPGRRNRIA